MNTTVISGRLVRNPGYNEVENEKGLHKIAKFVLAVRRNYSDEVSFIPVKAFAKKAEFARDYLMQGTKVMVEGEIVTGNYEDKDTGKKIYTTEVYANRIAISREGLRSPRSMRPIVWLQEPMASAKSA